MNIDFFVRNVKTLCKMKGVSPSRACIESGAGKTLMDNVKRGSVPSVDSVQLLARYLGVSTSELLGEGKAPITEAVATPDGLDELTDIYLSLNDEGREKLLDYADDLVKSGKYIKSGKNQLDKAKDA